MNTLKKRELLNKQVVKFYWTYLSTNKYCDFSVENQFQCRIGFPGTESYYSHLLDMEFI